MSEHSGQTAFPRLTISTFDELCHAESEIVKRINSSRNGPRLFLMNPQRLLNDVEVVLQPAVIEEWNRIAGDNLFRPNGLEAAYDAVLKSHGSSHVSVRIEHLVKREAS